MNFELTEEQIAVRDAAREFAKHHLLPEVIDRDIQAAFPKEQVKLMGELGFMGMMVS
ncbi:MAG: acyl-CoA dehydrogenase family protein, partial [Cyclobacteriaceae bacterium]